jgi:acetyltransferase
MSASIQAPPLSKKSFDVFFTPKSVAVIGATEKAEHVGRTILWNLISSPFGGTVYPVNPKRPSVLGIKAYASVADLPEKAELAIVVTPAETVPGMIRECAAAGVKGVIVISAGFRESGARGAELESEVLAEARKGQLRVIGPNCLGVMNPPAHFNATFAPAIARPGNVALISQSGAMCTAILDWSLREQVGFSAFVSIGSMLDVNWGDLIDHLGDDPHTRSIVIYMESIGDARSFLSAAREVALSKPIIVIKAGRSEATAKAAESHTGSLTGSDEVFEAAFRRVGVLRVNSISDIFYMTEVLARQPRPKGPRLAIVTNAGGPGVIAADALLAAGGELAPLSAAVMEALGAALPAHWSRNNPIDLIGDAGPERYTKALEVIAKDPNNDGLLVIMAPTGLTHPAAIAAKLQPFAKLPGKPILASWMGGAEASEGEAILNAAGIPTFPFPDTAARAFMYMWKYSYNLRGLYETPSQADAEHGDGRVAAAALLAGIRQTGRTILTETESKELLAAYGIPVVETRAAASEDEAVAHADAFGYPVAVKLLSHSITHKTDVGGVQLNIAGAPGVREAFRRIRESAPPGSFQGVTVQPMITARGYELIVGSSVDRQFGPVLLFGEGGPLVEVHRDHALALPPLNTTLARRLMEQTRIFDALKGVRGRSPVDLVQLEQILVRFSELVVEHPSIREIEINPLLATSQRLIALDARVVVYGQDTDAAHWPKPAIRPYPARFVSHRSFPDGVELHFRAIRPEDEPMVAAFHHTLSERSVYLRYFHWMKLEQRTDHDRLTRMCFIDYDRQMAFVAERRSPETGLRDIVGIGRLVKSHTANESELAVIVSDTFQRRGIGSQLVRLLIDFGREEKLERITATVLQENRAMQKIFEKEGFVFKATDDREALEAELDLRPPA